ncbi:MAG: hypothetical protein ACI4D3_06230 [Lachnospiraceae bacterium]
MYEYTISQWFIFFYIYCFLGWCFESAYVSICKRRPVNRGFMRGPLLPLYGSGAITVLFVALPFRDMPVMVYITGMIAATILEYIVGVVMEALFKVRYWDYSNQRFNIQGHICLSSSIAWGFLSMALIYGMHKPFEKLVLGLPSIFVSVAALVISMVAAADFTSSLKTALDIRDLIIQAERMRTELGHMKRRIEIIDTFARAQFEEKLEEKSEQLIDRLEDTMESRLGVEINLKERLQDTISDMSARVDALKDQALAARDKGQISGDRLEELGRIRLSLEVWNDRLKRQFSRDKKLMLRRNPGARYARLPGFLEELREGTKDNREEKMKTMEDGKVCDDEKR